MQRRISLGMLGALAAAASLVSDVPQKTDFAILPEVPVNSSFFSYVGPVILEIVEPGQKTYQGRVEYLVEALDRNGSVIASHRDSFERPYRDVAEENIALSELVTILLATSEEMEQKLPAEWRANPRYLIPQNAAAIRITADPSNKIMELDEGNNSYTAQLRQ